MRLAAALLLTTCSAAIAASAQAQNPSAEIGTSLGVTILSQSGTSVTHVGVPAAGGPLAQPSIYATIFTSPSVMFEPQVSFLSISSGGRNATAFDLGVQLGYLATPAERNSAYVAANAAWQTFSTGGGYSQNGAGLGGAVGYRMRAGAGLAVRLEARYRRWLGGFSGLNEFGIGIGLGGIL
jgi:hypothetical protein